MPADSYEAALAASSAGPTLATMLSASAEDADSMPDAVSAERLFDAVTAEFARATIATARVTAAAYRAVHARDRHVVAALLHGDVAAEISGRLLVVAAMAMHDRFEQVPWRPRRLRGFERDRKVTLSDAKLASTGRLVAAMRGEQAPLEAQRQRQNLHEQAALFMLRAKAFGESEQHFQALESLAGPDWWQRTESPWESLGSYGELYEGLERYELALERYEQAIDMFEQQRRLLTRDELKIAVANGNTPSAVLAELGGLIDESPASSGRYGSFSVPRPADRVRVRVRRRSPAARSTARSDIDLIVVGDIDLAELLHGPRQFVRTAGRGRPSWQ